MSVSRRLPPVLRVMGRISLLVGPLAFAALIAAINLSAAHEFPVPFETVSRVSLISLDFCVMALDCAIVIQAYKMRFYRAEREPHPLATWQRQIRAWAILAAVPLCDVVLALALSPRLGVYGIAFGVGMLEAWIAFGGVCWMILGAQP